jgi:hypothetical protein
MSAGVGIVVLAFALAVTSAGHVVLAASDHFLLKYSGVFALVALTGSVCMGVLATDRIVLTPGHRVLTQAVHRAVSFGALAFLVIHIVLEIAAPHLEESKTQHVHVLDAFIPFLSQYRTFYMAEGTIASDIIVLLVITGIIRRRFTASGHAWKWRAIHYSSYAALILGVLHGLLAGRQAIGSFVYWSYGIVIALIALAVLVRILAASLSSREAVRSASPHADASKAAGQSMPARAAALGLMGQLTGTMPLAGANRAVAGPGAPGMGASGALPGAMPALAPFPPVTRPGPQAIAALPGGDPALGPMVPGAPGGPGADGRMPRHEPGYVGPPRYEGAPAPRPASQGRPGPRVNAGTGPQPRYGTGPQPEFGTGPQPAYGAGSRPPGRSPSGRSGPQPGYPAGPPPRSGTGPLPRAATGPMPQAGTGPMPRPATGPQPRMGTGPIPRPGPGTGPIPPAGTGPQPVYREQPDGYRPGPPSGPPPGYGQDPRESAYRPDPFYQQQPPDPGYGRPDYEPGPGSYPYADRDYGQASAPYRETDAPYGGSAPYEDDAPYDHWAYEPGSRGGYDQDQGYGAPPPPPADGYRDEYPGPPPGPPAGPPRPGRRRRPGPPTAHERTGPMPRVPSYGGDERR